MTTKRTKIVCSIADSRNDVEFLRALYENGMNVVRINSAHATIEGAQKTVDNVREVSDKIAILIDTKGPEIRLTAVKEPFDVKTGDILRICDDTVKESIPGELHTTYPTISRDIPVGSHILIDDGNLDLLAVKVSDGALECKVLNDGTILGRKSVNVPGIEIKLPALTEKDRTFINWAIDANIDFIAHSFVRSAADLKEIQDILDARNSHLKIISKIENQQGIDNLDEILSNCFGVMVARGDLGVEIPTEKLPIVQDNIIKACHQRRKPVIVATQMLQSMMENPRPTRAEITDVAIAVFQAADAIMLSGETASGKYPIEAVQTMTRIALENEAAVEIDLELEQNKVLKPVEAVLARSMVASTLELPVKAIIFNTISGRLARYLSSFHPHVPLYAMCYEASTMRELALVRDVTSFYLEKTDNKEEYIAKSIDFLISEGYVKKGDLIGYVGGDSDAGATYMVINYL